MINLTVSCVYNTKIKCNTRNVHRTFWSSHVHSSRDDQTSLKPQTLKNINIKALIQGVTNNRIFDRIIFVLFLWYEYIGIFDDRNIYSIVLVFLRIYSEFDHIVVFMIIFGYSFIYVNRYVSETALPKPKRKNENTLQHKVPPKT